MKTLKSLLSLLILLILMTGVTLLTACSSSAAEEPLPTRAAPKATVLSPEQRNDQPIGAADYTFWWASWKTRPPLRRLISQS